VLLDRPDIAIPPLAADTVHVWTCLLSHYESYAKELDRLLSREERTRLERFAFERDRRRFALSHGFLRLILSSYAGEAPERLQFDQSPRGKPCLVQQRSGVDLRFSLSHSGAIALIAVTSARELGVDVEEMRADVHDVELAQRFFAPGESRLIAEATGERRRAMFYRYWTAKEAFLKGRGGGLSDGLDRFEVLWEPDLRSARVKLVDSGTIDPQWQVRELIVANGAIGAVAVEGDRWRLEQHGLPSDSSS
jgi:4'-phosphopantetheinyl transferase